jgi:hypothetical protein
MAAVELRLAQNVFQACGALGCTACMRFVSGARFVQALMGGLLTKSEELGVDTGPPGVLTAPDGTCKLASFFSIEGCSLLWVALQLPTG